MYRNQIQYDTNPFAGIVGVPYISQRVQFPFEEYLGTLQRVEQQRQQSLADMDKLDLMMSSIETIPGDTTANEKLDTIKSGINEQFEEFTNSKFGLADPNARDRLRVLAKQIYGNKDLKHIAEFTNAYKADEAERQKYARANKLSQVANPTVSAYNEAGEPVSYYGGWEERLDREKAKKDLVSMMEADITSSLDIPSNINPEDLFIKLQDNTKKEIALSKVENAIDLYIDSPEGIQELREMQQSKPGFTKDDLRKDVRTYLTNMSKLKNSIITDENTIGNPMYGKNVGGNPNGNSRFTVPSSYGADNDNKFTNAKDLRALNDQTDSRYGIRQDIMKIVGEDQDVKKSLEVIKSQIDNLNNNIDEKNKKIGGEIFEAMSEAYNSGKSIPTLMDLNLLEDNWQNLKSTGREAAASLANIVIKIVNNNTNSKIDLIDPKSETTKAIESIEKLKNDPHVSDFIKTLSNHFDLMDSKINNVLQSNGALAVTPVALNTYNEGYNPSTAAIKQAVELTKPSSFVLRDGNELAEGENITDIPMISRNGNELIFYAKTNKSNIHAVKINDPVSKESIVSNFGNAAFDIANDYQQYEGVNSEGTKFKLSNGKEESLPKGYKIERTLGEDGKIYYSLSKNGNITPIYYAYDTDEEYTRKDFVEPDDLIFIKFTLDQEKTK